MKRWGTLVILALGLAGQVAAGAPTTKTSAPQAPPPKVPAEKMAAKNSASATAKAMVTNTNNYHWFTPPPAARQSQIYRVGNMSSQPWTQIVGWNPGTSAFATGETAEPQLVLFSVDF